MSELLKREMVANVCVRAIRDKVYIAREGSRDEYKSGKNGDRAQNKVVDVTKCLDHGGCHGHWMEKKFSLRSYRTQLLDLAFTCT